MALKRHRTLCKNRTLYNRVLMILEMAPKCHLIKKKKKKQALRRLVFILIRDLLLDVLGNSRNYIGHLKLDFR